MHSFSQEKMIFACLRIKLCEVSHNTSFSFFLGYLANEDALKKLGIDEVIVFCVNDGAVMNAWAIDQKVPEDSIIKLMGDPYAVLTEKLEMELTHAGPKSVGLINRCKRHALYIVDGTIQIVRVAEKEDDPAGTPRVFFYMIFFFTFG